MKKPFMYGFKIIRPKHFLKQEVLHSWLATAHARSDHQHLPPVRSISRASSGFDGGAAMKLNEDEQQQHYLKWFNRFGCKSDQIEYRGFELDDFTHNNWDEMKIADVEKSAQGAGFSERMKIYSSSAERIFNQFYEAESVAPEQLIHVTCTGFESPSAAQKLISNKGWGKQTSVLHAYQMGCYAAFPAMGMAASRLAMTGGENPVDIVHTEMCGLHLDPSAHTPEQFVIQSLFADGFIRYSMVNEGAKSAKGKMGLLVEGFLEQLIPNSAHAMTWVCSDWGMQMTLDKGVPAMIANDITEYCDRLAKLSGHKFSDIQKNGIFAIHPGGPKIISAVQALLELQDHQVQHSKDTLKKYGNMSSGTVPHILSSIIDDPNIPVGTPIMSMAFGPGLTIIGAVFVKQAR